MLLWWSTCGWRPTENNANKEYIQNTDTDTGSPPEQHFNDAGLMVCWSAGPFVGGGLLIILLINKSRAPNTDIRVPTEQHVNYAGLVALLWVAVYS